MNSIPAAARNSSPVRCVEVPLPDEASASLPGLQWLIVPAFYSVKEASHVFIHWMDIVAPIGLFGLWVGFFAHQLGRKPLMPIEAAKLATGGHH